MRNIDVIIFQENINFKHGSLHLQTWVTPASYWFLTQSFLWSTQLRKFWGSYIQEVSNMDYRNMDVTNFLLSHFSNPPNWKILRFFMSKEYTNFKHDFSNVCAVSFLLIPSSTRPIDWFCGICWHEVLTSIRKILIFNMVTPVWC